MLKPIDIDEILSQLKLTPKMSGADFGTGPGHWAVGLARRLRKGLVYAIDIQDGCLSALEGKAKHNYLENLRFLKRDLTANRGSGLPDKSLEVVIMANMLFQVGNEQAVITEAGRVLKKHGKLLMIDSQTKSPIIQNQKSISQEEIVEIAEQSNFHLLERLNLGDYYFGFIFNKN